MYVDENKKNAVPAVPTVPQLYTILNNSTQFYTMQAKMMAPIEHVRGKIAKGYYARVQYGKQIIQRCPRRLKPPTEAQLKAQEWFAENLPGRKWREYRESQSGNRVVSEEMGERG